ncbi:hypothetical protein HDU87_002541 [Geranomyces variabilis]|uniref:Uncharacterized protein n=1 Tax=Geranomyces variabilis TaxID=109894 RepID=A0AAD5TTD8_9FUNG|nr:hypothetical protein HDU87_002541 [Geranomyces variabilis]
MASSTTGENVAALVPCVVILAAYHAYLHHRIATTPGRTVYGLSRAARRVWVAAIMFRKNEILAVQTLRNWVMASSFLATTAVLLITAVLALVGQMAVRWSAETANSPVFYMVTFVTDDWFRWRLALFIACMAACFSCFTQSVRFFNHAAMICNVNLTPEELETILEPPPKSPFESLPSSDSPESSVRRIREDPSGACYRTIHGNPSRVASVLNRGCFYYTMGMRCYYLSFPVVAWFWGPVPLAVATVILVAMLRVIDFQLSDFTPLPPLRAEQDMSEIRTSAV